VQWVAKLEGRGNARPADVAGRIDNGKSRRPPQGMLRFFHVAKHPGKMDDAGEIGFCELHAAGVAELALH
jgi:hypothetical protein